MIFPFILFVLSSIYDSPLHALALPMFSCTPSVIIACNHTTPFRSVLRPSIDVHVILIPAPCIPTVAPVTTSRQ